MNKDGDVEARAIKIAQSDNLEWVKRPASKNQEDTPEAATNAQRDSYRRQAREQMDGRDQDGRSNESTS